MPLPKPTLPYTTGTNPSGVPRRVPTRARVLHTIGYLSQHLPLRRLWWLFGADIPEPLSLSLLMNKIEQTKHHNYLHGSKHLQAGEASYNQLSTFLPCRATALFHQSAPPFPPQCEPLHRISHHCGENGGAVQQNWFIGSPPPFTCVFSHRVITSSSRDVRKLLVLLGWGDAHV